MKNGKQQKRRSAPPKLGGWTMREICFDPRSLPQTTPTQLSNVRPQPTLFDFHEKEFPLDPNYKIKRHDVICGTRRETYPGNERFRVLLEMRVERYQLAATRIAKVQIVAEILHGVRQAGGNFIRQQQHASEGDGNEEEDGNNESAATTTSNWIDIGNTKAREKTTNALRNLCRKMPPVGASSSSSTTIAKCCFSSTIVSVPPPADEDDTFSSATFSSSMLTSTSSSSSSFLVSSASCSIKSALLLNTTPTRSTTECLSLRDVVAYKNLHWPFCLPPADRANIVDTAACDSSEKEEDNDTSNLDALNQSLPWIDFHDHDKIDDLGMEFLLSPIAAAETASSDCDLAPFLSHDGLLIDDVGDAAGRILSFEPPPLILTTSSTSIQQFIPADSVTP